MEPILIQNPKFNLGELVITSNAHNTLNHSDYSQALQRHAQGDWGELCGEDQKSNEQALSGGGRIFSVYQSSDNVKFWIITESDYSVTTVLLPEDY